jgi:hypothetical protein
MDEQVTTHSEVTEPSGVALKAAYLLLREMNKSPEPPSMESMALLLDNVLHYEWAVRLIRLTSDSIESQFGPDCMKEGLSQFKDWADNTLLG